MAGPRRAAFVDAGSTDSGPYYLGTGQAKTTANAVRRDLRVLLAAARDAGIPLIVGSCGTSGCDAGVRWVAGIVRDICAEDGPGDILHGDEHGVLHVPEAAMPAIFTKAELIREDEQRIVSWSRSADFSIPRLLELRRIRH